ncbi:MAG: extracellular solute-binding protein [Chloroflexi bacterium]|nr:extracellular solute-binding protein [Chloroflexota bacterium]
MKQSLFPFLALVVVFSLFSVGCSPASPPPARPAPTTAPPAALPAVAPTLTPEQKAWEEVVAAARKEGKLTLYSFNFIGDVGRAFIKTFGDRYGIKVDIVAGIGTVLVERIKSEQKAGQATADVFDSALSLVNIAKQDGLTQPYGYLPVLEEKDVWNIHPKADPEGHLLGVRSSTITPYINTKLVKPGDAPRSYRSLLEPQWKKKVTIDSPLTSPVSIWMYLATLKAGVTNDDYWRQLTKQEPVIAPGFREMFLKLIQGEAQVAIDGADGSIAPFVKEGALVQAVPLEDGVLVAPYSVAIAIIKNAPHPNAARLFLNWLSSQEGENTYSQAAGGIAVYRKDVPDARAAAIKADIKKVIPIDLAIQLEATRVQREGTFAKILGLEK